MMSQRSSRGDPLGLLSSCSLLWLALTIGEPGISIHYYIQYSDLVADRVVQKANTLYSTLPLADFPLPFSLHKALCFLHRNLPIRPVFFGFYLTPCYEFSYPTMGIES